MRKLRKILKVTGITFLILLLIAFLIPIVFKKQITSLVKTEINKSLNATVDFKDVKLSLFKRFPKVSISVEDFHVIGMNEYANDTLISGEKLDASANLFSVIKGEDIKIFGLFLQAPRIRALVNKDGLANWDIAKTDTAGLSPKDTSASVFKLSLKKYTIENGYIVYRDESAGTFLEMEDVDHEGSGDITQDVFTLKTDTKVASFSITQDAIPYLANTKTDIKTDIAIDTRTNTYTFRTDDVALNELKLSMEGFFRLVNDSSYAMDIKFKSPSNEFGDILSMVPGIYREDFSNIKTSGNAVFNGFVKGTYSPSQIPAYDVNLEVKDGFFQYPDLPKPVKNIQFSLHASNVDGLPDNTVIDLSKGHLEMDNEPFDFRFIFRNPVTSKYIDAAAKGKIDLSQVSQFIKLDAGTKLSGAVSADAYAKGEMGSLEKQSGNFTAGGFFDIVNLAYSSNDFPQPVRNGNMKVQLDNQGGVADNTNIRISEGHMEVGNDPLDFSLELSNPVTVMNFNGAAKGRFTLNYLRQFIEMEAGSSVSGVINADMKFAGNKTMIDAGDYDKIRLNGNARVDNVKYISVDYPTGIAINSATANLEGSNVSLTGFKGSYLQSNFSGDGVLNNLVGFAIRDEPLRGNINASVDKMNLNDWTGTASSAPIANTGAPDPVASGPFLVPANMDISLNAKAGRVTYDKVDYNNIRGVVELENETVKFQNVSAEALDGTVTINGAYSTLNNKTKPDIGLSYNIKNVDVQKAFLSFNTIRAIMPIGKFLSGKLNSELTMTGNMNGEMMPDLKTLTGKGNLLLIEGVLKKFAPLEKLATALQIDRLKSISIRDIKNYIEFANGKVLVKPFTLKIDDIVMEIGGMHGFDQTIEYSIAMKVPRKYLGNAGNDLINNLVSSAVNRGIPVNLGEMVDLSVKVGGSMANPQLKIDLEKVVGDAMNQIKEQAKDFAKEKLDSAKARVKDSLNAVSEKLKDKVKDKIRDQLFGKDTTKTNNPVPDSSQKPKPDIKKKIRDIFNKPRKNASDTSGQ